MCGLKSEGSVINRIESIIEKPVWILQVRVLAVRLDKDQPDESGANLHDGVGDAVEPVLSQRMHRLLDGAELIRRVLIEDRDAFAEILCAGNEGLDLVDIDASVGVGLLRRFEHHFLKREMLASRSRRCMSDADDGNAISHLAYRLWLIASGYDVSFPAGSWLGLSRKRPLLG